MTLHDADGNVIGRAVPYTTDGTPLEGDPMPGTIHTPNGDVVGRTALYQVAGGTAVPITDLGGTAAEQVTADAPLVATPSGDNVTLSVTTDQPGGVPLLDDTGLVKLAQMPISGLNYHGNWDASTNTPALADGTGTSGDMYRVHVAGTQDLGSGSTTFEIGDLVVYEGAVWQKFAAATGVISVNGQTGAVSLTYADLPDRPITRQSGAVALQLDGDELIWPNDIVSGKIRLWNTTPGSANTYYGFGIANGTLLYQVDSNTSEHRFQGVDGSDNALDILHMSAQAGIVASVDLHMSEKKIVNVGTPDSARDAATKAYVDTAVSDAGHLTVAIHTEADAPSIATGDPQVQLYDLSAASVNQDVNLPADAPTGTVFTVKKIDSSSNALFMFTQGGQLLDGQDSASIADQHGFLTIVFDGTNWRIIGRN